MNNIIRKFTSRKFLMAVVGIITGVATSLSGSGGDVGAIAGLVLTATSIITYILTEGKIDSANKQISLDSEKITDIIFGLNVDGTKLGENVKKGVK